MYRIFLNFPKSCILSCFQNAIIRKLLNAIETELEGSGNSIGYRQMHQRLRIDYGLVVQKETVRVIIKELDPAGVQSRSRLLLLKALTPKRSF